MLLYHYFEAEIGPFRTISSLPDREAETILGRLRSQGATFAGQRAEDYLQIRREIENMVRMLFLLKGGKTIREYPQYFTVGRYPWLRSWYRNGKVAILDLDWLDPQQVSFTFGDTFPALRYEDGKAHRGQVYTRVELEGLIAKYGFPQDTNPDGSRGPDRYIEAQVWQAQEEWLPFVQTSD